MKRNLLILTSVTIFLLASMGCSAVQTTDNTEVSIAAKQQTESTAATVPTNTSKIDVTQAETPVENEDSADEEEIVRPEGWGEETHSKKTEPDYDVVFPQDRVNRITITIDPENWEAMQANMVELHGESGRGQQGPGRGLPENGERPQPPVSENGEMPGEGQLPPQGEQPQLPEEAISACSGLSEDSSCTSSGPMGTMTGTCVTLKEQLVCMPEGFSMSGEGQLPPQGERPQPPAFPENGEMPERGQPPQQGERPEGGGPGGPGFGGGGDFGQDNPMWITATLEFEGNTWTNVGVRYKGNSSLMNSWSSGSSKLPLKLDFDEFEDDYPEIKNQRFYGFKQLSLANGFGDDTYMRETVAYDLLEEAGLVAAETAYYEVILDYGEGPVNLGLYTAIEVIDDTAIERYFGDDKGNIYEGDGQAVSLAEGTFDRIKDSFVKENNEDEADWSDIEALYNVLHSEERTTNPEVWRTELELVFDVDTFLEWLAISAALQHWDTYGGMTHNFYLYHNPDTDQLVWISWDHNHVLGGMGGGGRDNDGERRPEPPTMGENPAAPAEESPEGQQQQPTERMGPGGPRGGGPGGGRNVTLDKANVGDNWPLIRYLLDDPTYYERYLNYLEEAGNLLDPEALTTKYQTLAELLRPYVDNPDTFDNAVESLVERTIERHQAVTEFLAKQ